jgi:ABC-type polysaccharide/polyol phosphate export permease
MIKEIIKYRDLLTMLTLRDIRIRYKQAAMGFLWALFMPLVAVLAGILIKKAMSVVSGKPLDTVGVIAIAVKVLPWTFFVSGLKFSVQTLVSNQNLVTKIYFPRAVLPLAAILACLFDLAVAMVVLSALLVVFKIGASVHLLWVPLILVFLIAFTAGLGILLSAANLFYRDVKYIVEVILMFGIFFTPVFFEAGAFGEWGKYLLLNPVGSLLESLTQAVVYHHAPDLGWLSYAGICSLLMLWWGIKIFEAKEPYFAENI